MCLQWFCVQACSTRRHSVRDFRAYINQSCSCEGLYYYFQLTPATAESLPTLTTYAEQTSAGKSDAIILGDLRRKESFTVFYIAIRQLGGLKYFYQQFEKLI
jgi:hypothetical protein